MLTAFEAAAFNVEDATAYASKQNPAYCVFANTRSPRRPAVADEALRERAVWVAEG
jgi:hypothetical protein